VTVIRPLGVTGTGYSQRSNYRHIGAGQIKRGLRLAAGRSQQAVLEAGGLRY